MALKIVTSTLFTKRVLSVDSSGVKFEENFGTKRFAFSQVDYVLISPSYLLSFQAGQEIFSIQTKPDNPKHQAAITTLLQEVRRTASTGPVAG